MSNPMLNDKRLQAAAAGGSTVADSGQWNPPIDDGPVSAWNPEVMTVRGTAWATTMLLGLLLVAAVFGWNMVDAPEGEVYEFPAMAIGGVLLGFLAVIVLHFKPTWGKILGPVYAVAQGVFVGAISRAYETAYDGIVLQAAGVTVAVFATMLFLYGTRILKVTYRFRRIVIGATIGVAVFYLGSLLFSLFGATPPFISSASIFGIGFSLFVAGLAAFNLALDFDFIERGSAARLPAHVEWYAAVGLLVTIVWLYLEILRLLAKLRER
jgi:uncharacterized YccA/Bax inhibitor family protein